MIVMLLLLSLSMPAAGPDVHLQSNPLYQDLRQKGVAVTDTKVLPAPGPLMADGLTAGEQKALIKKLLGDDIDYDAFMEDTVTAPYLLMPLRDLEGKPDAPARGLDLYFMAHGKFKVLTNKEVLDRMGGGDRNKGKSLTTEDLKKRGITIPPDAAKREGFGHGSSVLIDKVELNVTGQSIWSETGDSLLLASRIDPRFTGDKEFPNVWRSLEKTGEGEFTKGPPLPYQTGGYYVKVTRIKDLDDTLFVECHVLFTEPDKWFNGTNLLRAKLPPAAQDMARKLRRELIKASKEAGD